MYKQNFVLIPSHSASSETQIFYQSDRQALALAEGFQQEESRMNCEGPVFEPRSCALLPSKTSYPKFQWLKTIMYLLMIL